MAQLAPSQSRLQLSGGGCRCSGLLEVQQEAAWGRLCWDSFVAARLAGACQQLGCGPSISKPLQTIVTGGKEPQMRLERCRGRVTDLAGCSLVPANCTQHIFLSCREPVKTTPEPTSVPPTTTLEPTGSPRLRLVDGGLQCSGFVELHKEGLWGAVASSPGLWPRMATHICQQLGCGTAVSTAAQPQPEQGSHLPVRWEVLEPCSNHSALHCFNRTRGQRGHPPAFLTCEGSQPRVLRRLVAGATPCEGDLEVFHQGRWQGLCDSREQRAQWGQQLCQELQCGNLSSSTKSQAPPAMGVTCKASTLHLCSGKLGSSEMCSRTRVVCQDSKPPPVGTSAGTIVSICLALLLLGILLLLCGPPAYRRLMKRMSQKKQRQWIGPTGLSQTASFHRNSTVSVRPRAEGQRGQGDNDYAQPPQKSLSAYPALEGACRASNPPDNSSDSDYDLSSARRV
ncbi:T-cell surface glycoprotein CD5 [Indicator indicator]|uniref:T-cell surface glycoprotein CD5 n=1 Tax=Indicator indicator TaxID=1002788 RepID=UPI0023DEFA96|nr:T-cell surface glycoprotein CD5 [Indicator indicator]